MRTSRLLVAVLCSLSLLLASCSAPVTVDPSVWRGTVGGQEIRAEVASVTVVFPAGVAPPGTQATVRVEPVSPPPGEGTVPLSETVSVTLADGAQPQESVTLTLPVQAAGVASERLAEQYWMFVSAVDAGGESFSSGTFDPVAGTYTVSVDHFTGFQVLGIDLGAVLGEVRTAVMQGLGLEFPAPDCVDKQATVGNTKYDIVSTPATHLCVEERGGNLVVRASPRSAMPFRINTQPRVDGSTEATEAGVGTAGVIVFARALGFIGSGRYAAAFPGAQASFVFKGAPSSVALELEQYPALLLMAILAKTLDTLGITTVAELEGLQCLTDIVETNQALRERVDGDAVGAFARAFFSCAGTAADLSPLGRFLLAAVGAAPAFLVTSIVGILNEFTGQARYEVELTVTQGRPAASIGLKEGGGLVIGGTMRGRQGPEEIKLLTEVLGSPDSQRSATCSPEASVLTERRWGDLAVFSLETRFVDEGSGATWEAGGISGWKYDPTLSAKTFPTVVPPKGITIGTPGATVEAKYRADDIFSVWREGSSIEAFAGDTVDITFVLDSAGKVASMNSGWGC